jgi:hypothetical protein
MGNTSYSVDNRATRSNLEGYTTKNVNQIFTQNVERKAHKDMVSQGVTVRESCDSETHPKTVPIQLYLDVTGSMGHIPHELIKEGLPTLMSNLIQKGVEDAALMFGSIGDHEYDSYPLQIAQFESGDAELDMWLTRTYLEGKGGGNKGESYLLAWYFAAYHTRTDAFDKRGKKGYVITIGDEPCLRNLPLNAAKSIMGSTCQIQDNTNWLELLEEARKKNHVFHIHVNHGRSLDPLWKEALGENLIEVNDYKEVPNVIANLVIENERKFQTNEQVVKASEITVSEDVKNDSKTDISNTPHML